MSEERRNYIESTKNIIRVLASIGVWVWPSLQNWRDENLEDILNMKITEDMLEEFAEKYGRF